MTHRNCFERDAAIEKALKNLVEETQNARKFIDISCEEGYAAYNATAEAVKQAREALNYY